MQREFDRDFYHDDGYFVERMRVSADASVKATKPAVHRVQRVKGESKRSSAKSGDGNSDDSDSDSDSDSDDSDDSDLALSTSTSSLSNTQAARREALRALHNLGHISESTLKICVNRGFDAADAWLIEHDEQLEKRAADGENSTSADVLHDDNIRNRHHGIKLPPRDSMAQPAQDDTPVPAIFTIAKTDKKWASDEQIGRLCGANRFPDPTEALEYKQEIDAAKSLMQERVALGLLKMRDKKRVERVLSGWKIEEIAEDEGVTLACVYTSLKKSAGEIAVGLEKRAAALAWAADRDARDDLPPLPDLAAAVQVGLFDEVDGFGGAE